MTPNKSTLFIQLNNVNNEIKNKVLSLCKIPLATRCYTGNSTSSCTVKPFEANIERKMLGCQALPSIVRVPTVQC